MEPDLEIDSSELTSITKKQSGRNWVLWSMLLILLVLLSILGGWIISIKSHYNRESDRIKAFRHARSTLIAFTEFEGEFGVHLGANATTSNECFRELLQRLQTVRSEAIFYAPSRISKQPDNDIGDESTHFAEACGKGEVGFLYVFAPTATEDAPLIAAPLYDLTGKFDAKAYDGVAIVMMRSGEVKAMDIDPETGKVMVDVDGKRVDLFSADNPAFIDPPVIKYPEPK